MTLNEKYNEYLSYFNNELTKTLAKYTEKLPHILCESMKYAVEDGGKRVRPVFCLATAEILGINREDVINFAIAIECIHSYSLVHDDLPAMDNDDFRRGKFSTHKKFGEEYGILCGDALLNFATEIVLKKNNFTKNDADALALLMDYSGANGMIKGQVLDLFSEKKENQNEELLLNIFINKTSKLLTAPLLISSILANRKFYDDLYNFGLNFGIMFQITDDILDVEGTFQEIGKTPHKDEKDDKLTSIKIYSLEGAKKKAEEYYNKCIYYLSNIPNSTFLVDFTKKIFERKN